MSASSSGSLGEAPTYLFFWGHTPKRAGVVDASHFMKASKARLFRDERTLALIVRAKSPSEAKDLGRRSATTTTTTHGRRLIN